MPDVPRRCDTHLDRFKFNHPLPHLTESLKRQRKTRIVTIGSSSTAGEGDVTPYPARLELLLRGRFRDRMIDVLNRGLGGQEAPSEVSRFEPDVFDEAPSLVIWQVGTNAVFRNEVFNFDEVAVAIDTGLEWLAGMPIDVVLMDLQYIPAVITPDKLTLSRDMVARISAAAEKARVNVFRRFDLMEHWVRADGIPIEELVRPDDHLKLHMSDWATGCMTRALFEAIKLAIEEPPST
jgi:acyl-CoA thioesterase-1